MKSTAKVNLLLIFSLLAALLTPALAQAANVKLTVSKFYSGILLGPVSGTVTSSPAGIDCGKTCSAGFAKGTSVTLAATPAAGSRFVSWTGACAGQGSTCTVLMSTAQTTTANFDIAPVPLTLNLTGTGTGSVDNSLGQPSCATTCVYYTNPATQVVLIAHPGAGSVFSGWSGACTNKDNTCSVLLMSQTQTVTANFTIIPPGQLTIIKSGTGTGTVTSNPAGINCGATCTVIFNQNSTVTLTATAAAGSSFTGWTGACTGTANTCTVTMSQAKTVGANFDLVLTVTKSGTGTGTVTSSPTGIDCGATCTASFAPNTYVTLTAIPAAGSTFTGWTGDCTSTASTCSMSSSPGKTVDANFILTPLPLTISTTGSGTVTSSPAGIDCGATCTASFAPNTYVTLTATPAAGVTFGGWTGACTGTASTCTVMMSQAQTVGANFMVAPELLTVTQAGTGTGTVTSNPAGINCGTACTANFNQNSTVTLTATVSAGSSFTGWTGACTGTANTCTMTMGQAQTVTAGFSFTYASEGLTTYQYDPNGNLTQVTDPLGNIRQFQYDSLDQAVLQIEPDPNNPGHTLGQTSAAYDSLGQVTKVTDPRNLATGYQKDNLGNLLSLTSPDTGTSQNAFDDAGNLITHADARNQTATYSYDSQNRITQAVYPDQTITYGWDSCTHGIGRLCSLTNAGISLNLNYELHGRVTSKAQTVGTVTLNAGYSYNAAGQLIQTTTPSGQAIGYVWLNDHIQSINLNGQPLVTQIVYDPDGQITGWTWSNGTTSERQYDLAGHPVTISLGLDGQSLLPTLRNYSYDAAGKVTGIVDSSNSALDQAYGYDGLDRLITGQQGAFTLTDTSYAYDLSGNRTGKTQNTTPVVDSIDPGSNRLLQKSGAQTVNYSYDLAGHLLSDGATSYTYNGQGRRSGATSTNLNAGYGYNALGQRVSKTVNGVTTLFFYDQQGRLAGEYDATGQLRQEIVWLGGLPVAVLKPTTPASAAIDVFYVHADHLGTPRKITRPSDNKVLWTWESEAFGTSLPDQNPSGLGDFVFNLRFPGQYYDNETGLFYNYFRDYDPATGRYSESDPIGLAGGINTYTYVEGNPVNYTDPLGLLVVINGTNPRATSILDEAYRKLKKTKKGKELCEKLENSDEVYTIRNDSPTKLFKNRWFYHDYTKSIVVNVDHLPVINTVDGPRPSPMEVTLGHEIGHAATGIDDGPSNAQMENVIANENPIRAELKLPARTTYP